MRASAAALPALEVAVAGRGAAFAGLQNVGVHPQTHRAASLAPLKAGASKDLVESLRLCRPLYGLRSGDNHRVYFRIDSVSLHHACRGAQVFNASIST